MKGVKEMKIITEAMYVIKGFKKQNRKACAEGENGDIWREVYVEMDRITVKPTIHKIKSHMTVIEAAGLLITNP